MEYDPFSYGIQEDPYSTYEELRESCPVYRNPKRDFWALSRFADVQAALRDYATFSSEPDVNLETEMNALMLPGGYVSIDPPRHTQLRAITRDTFTPKAVSALEPQIKEIATELIDAFRQRGAADIVHDYSAPLPALVISSIMGIPHSEAPMVKEWSDTLEAREPDDDRVPTEGADAVRNLQNYLSEMVSERRKRPGSDLISKIAQAEIDGSPLSHEEATGMCFMLFVGGNETTDGLISSTVVHLAQRPELRRQIIDDPKQLPVVLEEILRFDSPVQYLTRTATRDVEIHGKVIPEGARVLAMYASANRDERVFENAWEFDPSRPTRRHLAFGEGIHFCIGAGLGRLEARIAVELLLESFPDYEIDGDPVRFHHSHFRRFASVPFKFDMAKRSAAAEAGTA